MFRLFGVLNSSPVLEFFKQYVRVRNWVGIGLSYRTAMQATQSGGIGYLELILGLLKSLKIWALHTIISRGSIPTDINSDDVPWRLRTLHSLQTTISHTCGGTLQQLITEEIRQLVQQTPSKFSKYFFTDFSTVLYTANKTPIIT